MAYVINSIGQARYSPTDTLFVPVWSSEADELVLDRDARDRMTRILLSLAGDEVRFTTALESKREGVSKVMVLTYMTNPSGGEWISPEPFGLQDAYAASVASLRKQEARTEAFGATPIWVVPHKVDERKVVQYLPRTAYLANE